MNQWAQSVITVGLVLLLAGCATHSDRMSEATDLIRQGDFVAAETAVEEVLSANRDRLLRLIEVGTLRHLQGDYLVSHEQLDAADQLAHQLFAANHIDLLNRLTQHAGRTTYRGEVYERVYIHYFKLLNFLSLAAETDSPEQRRQWMDAARVEARRAQLILDTNLNQVGDYAQAADERGQLLHRMRDVFEVINGSLVDTRALVFRDNAFIHYLIGSLYEQLGEIDHARVSYERAARTYEQGYAQQYQLDPALAGLAWFEVARLLKRQQDPRWRSIASERLNDQQRDWLAASDTSQVAQLLVIHEADMTGQRGELNLWMSVTQDGRRLVIRPILTGDDLSRAYQLAWFYTLYADRGLLMIAERLYAEDYLGILTSFHEKVLPLPGAVRSALENLGLMEILQSTGVRLAVPYYQHSRSVFPQAEIRITGQPHMPLLLADSPSAHALAQHLVNARRELSEAMAVESLRLSLCVQTGLPPVLCSLTAATTTRADTRAWMTLPQEVRVQRVQLEPGTYDLELNHGAGGRTRTRITLAPGELQVWRVRDFVSRGK